MSRILLWTYYNSHITAEWDKLTFDILLILSLWTVFKVNFPPLGSMKGELKYQHKYFRLQNMIPWLELFRIDNFLYEVDINVPMGSAVQKNLLTISKNTLYRPSLFDISLNAF